MSCGGNLYNLSMKPKGPFLESPGNLPGKDTSIGPGKLSGLSRNRPPDLLASSLEMQKTAGLPTICGADFVGQFV